MRRTTKYVALDVHQATTVVSVREANRRVICTGDPSDWGVGDQRVLRRHAGIGAGSVRGGDQAQWLHDLLLPLVDRIVVCHRRGEHRGMKADQKDADQLSARLLSGDLGAVYHGSTDRMVLRELTRTYANLVEDSTRAMLRLKSLFRSVAIPTPGRRVYSPRERAKWLAKLSNRGARHRAEALYAQIDLLGELRPKAKAAMIAEARRDPAWKILRTIPFLGPVRVSLILATMKTPFQGRGHGSRGPSGSAPGALPRHDRAGHAGGHGPPDRGTEAGRHDAATLEARRSLRSSKAEHAIAIPSGVRSCDAGHRSLA
jgi:hypothetical protein